MVTRKTRLNNPVSVTRGVTETGLFSLPKNTNLVGSIGYLLHVKFRQIPFYELLKRTSWKFLANQRQGWPSLVLDWPEKHKLTSRRHWVLASWQVEYVSAILIQTERPSLFSDQPEKKHTLGRGCWVHAIEDDVPIGPKKMCVYGPPTLSY